MACRRCKSSFAIPDGGLQAFPANVYVDALVLMKELCMSDVVRPGCGDDGNSTADSLRQASNSQRRPALKGDIKLQFSDRQLQIFDKGHYRCSSLNFNFDPEFLQYGRCSAPNFVFLDDNFSTRTFSVSAFKRSMEKTDFSTCVKGF